MKRVRFADAQELRSFCTEAEVSLVVEFRDENKKQRQVILQGESLDQVQDYVARPEAVAYYRKDGIFYEVVATWLKK